MAQATPTEAAETTDPASVPAGEKIEKLEEYLNKIFSAEIDDAAKEEAIFNAYSFLKDFIIPEIKNLVDSGKIDEALQLLARVEESKSVIPLITLGDNSIGYKSNSGEALIRGNSDPWLKKNFYSLYADAFIRKLDNKSALQQLQKAENSIFLFFGGAPLDTTRPKQEQIEALTKNVADPSYKVGDITLKEGTKQDLPVILVITEGSIMSLELKQIEAQLLFAKKPLYEDAIKAIENLYGLKVGDKSVIDFFDDPKMNNPWLRVSLLKDLGLAYIGMANTSKAADASTKILEARDKYLGQALSFTFRYYDPNMSTDILGGLDRNAVNASFSELSGKLTGDSVGTASKLYLYLEEEIGNANYLVGILKAKEAAEKNDQALLDEAKRYLAAAQQSKAIVASLAASNDQAKEAFDSLGTKTSKEEQDKSKMMESLLACTSPQDVKKLFSGPGSSTSVNAIKSILGGL